LKVKKFFGISELQIHISSSTETAAAWSQVYESGTKKSQHSGAADPGRSDPKLQNEPNLTPARTGAC
jgi:hypothetical protein